MRSQPERGAGRWETSWPPQSSTSSREEPLTGLPDGRSAFLSEKASCRNMKVCFCLKIRNGANGTICDWFHRFPRHLATVNRKLKYIWYVSAKTYQIYFNFVGPKHHFCTQHWLKLDGHWSLDSKLKLIKIKDDLVGFTIIYLSWFSWVWEKSSQVHGQLVRPYNCIKLKPPTSNHL